MADCGFDINAVTFRRVTAFKISAESINNKNTITKT
jgi:hypothetical protein